MIRGLLGENPDLYMISDAQDEPLKVLIVTEHKEHYNKVLTEKLKSSFFAIDTAPRDMKLLVGTPELGVFWVKVKDLYHTLDGAKMARKHIKQYKKLEQQLDDELNQYKDFFTSHPLEALSDFELEVDPPKWKSDYVKEQARLILANFDCVKHNSKVVSRNAD